MSIALYGRTLNNNFFQYFEEIINILNSNNIKIFVYEPLFNSIKNYINFSQKNITIYQTYTEINKKVEFIISIGGDGTFLECVTFLNKSSLPVLGINSGRLGFLANIQKENIQEAINSTINKQYTIEPRTLLKITTSNDEQFDGFNYALNEITIHKSDSSSMINIHTYLENEFLNSYWADGLIISTPTGSTAYSLSAGGPIVVPISNTLIITPLAPHNLNVRSLIINDNNKISLKIETRSNNYLASLDYRSKILDKQVEITVEKAEFKANILKLNNQSFFKTLRTKLMWGEDKRN